MIDTNLKGVLYGIAAALPVFQRQGSGHFINVASVAGIKVLAPGGVVYSATKFAVRALSEGLRQEAGKTVRTTLISPAPSKASCSSAALTKRANSFSMNFISRLFRLTRLPEPFYLLSNSLATLILMKLLSVQRRKNFSMS
jgi:NADP-dependent 3-hydroxy acid dehydrogenase YdfG